MMNMLEEAIIYATVLHQGKVRKIKNSPYILHPLEVAHILSTITDDLEVITAGILHDIVEDTDGTLEEIETRFGKRVAFLVASESENKYPGEDPADTWKKRKEESIEALMNTQDQGVRMLWLADKLSNMRSLAGMYSEMGDEIWKKMHQGDPQMHKWYYSSIAEALELTLNKTGAFKEYIKHINFIWPGTFDKEKARYKKYKEVSVEGCKLIGRGSKGDVYRYDDELIIKVFNGYNTYRDVEQEIALSRKAFVLGMPTAISFGIVSVGEKYGAMYELVDADTVSRCISANPMQADAYARIMASAAHTIHDIEVSQEDDFPEARIRFKSYITSGIGKENRELSEKCMRLLDTLSGSDHLVHGDFHTGNVFLQNGEPLLIDMDRLSTGHPMYELMDLYYFYIALGEDDPEEVYYFMGFTTDICKIFFHSFLKYYLDTDDEDKIAEVTEKASLVSYSRLIRRILKKGTLSPEREVKIDRYIDKIRTLTDKLDTLTFEM